MRVAIDARMIHSRPTGIGRVTINLIEHLARIGSKHEFVAIGPDEALNQLGNARNIFRARAPFSHLSLRAHTEFPKIIKQSGVDIVHYLYFVTPLYSPVPSVVTLFDATYARFPNLFPPHHRLLYRFCMNQCIKQSRHIICSSQATSEDLYRFFPGSYEHKIRVIPLGVESRFKPVEISDISAARNALGLPDPYILYVGNYRGQKNLRRLIEAFSSIAKDIPHHLVLPKATGPGSEITLSAVDECRLADRILFHSMPDDDLPLIYGLADAFVFPSLSEGFGLPPLEAMACGTPVITSNISSLPEVVGDAGIMVDPYNVEELAEAIRRVLSDAQLRQQMRQKGLERAALFTWENTARKTVEVYKEVLSG